MAYAGGGGAEWVATADGTGSLTFRLVLEGSEYQGEERMRELESRGLVERTELEVGVQYELTDMGRDLDAAVDELRSWARRWLR